MAGKVSAIVDKAKNNWSKAVNTPLGGPLNKPISNVVQNVVQGAKSVMSFSDWISNHWRLSVVVLVAIIILLKD